MTEKQFKLSITIPAAIFLLVFLFYTSPPALDVGIISAFAGGFVNPFAAGYSTDVIMCWFIMVGWIVYEKQTLGIKHGWICIVLGVIPGVAVGFAAYLWLRNEFLKQHSKAPLSNTDQNN